MYFCCDFAEGTEAVFLSYEGRLLIPHVVSCAFACEYLPSQVFCVKQTCQIGHVNTFIIRMIN